MTTQNYEKIMGKSNKNFGENFRVSNVGRRWKNISNKTIRTSVKVLKNINHKVENSKKYREKYKSEIEKVNRKIKDLIR